MKKLLKSLSQFLTVISVFFMTAGMLTSCNDDDNPGGFPPDTDKTTVSLTDYWECYYFLPATYDYGNYFFQLRTGEVGTDGYKSYPLNPGDYILDIDIYHALDPDHHNPVLPEGRYHATESHQNDHDMVFTLQNTIAIYNVESLDNGQSRFRYIRFSDGTIDVKHTSDGKYILDCNFLAKEDGSEWHFTYEGELPFEDQSGIDDEDWWGFEGSTQFTAKKANYNYYDESEELGADNYIMRFFDTENTTLDQCHVNEKGNKIQLNIYTAHNAGIAGTYTIRDSRTPGSCLPGERFGAGAVGSYVERVREDYSVRYALISEGTVTITEGASGAYNVTINGKTPEGADVKMTYAGVIEDISDLAPIYSTLESDIVVTPTACTEANYYGDYYENGTVNYGFYLANEEELLVFDILAASGTPDELPTGTFTISDTNEAGSMLRGSIEGSSIIPTAYVKFGADQDVVAFAPIAGGSLTISKSGDTYTFSFSLDDDADPAHKITGSVSCPVPELNDYTEGSTSALRSSIKQIGGTKTIRLRR